MIWIAEWLFKFFAWLARRPLLKIRIVEDKPEQEPGGLIFEVENAGPTSTSLMPTVRSWFWFPERGHYRKGYAVYDVRELDRELSPFKVKMLTASPRSLPPGYEFAWFRVYEFQPRCGPRARVRIRNSMLEPLGPLKFAYELWRFRMTGRVDKATPVTVAGMEAQRRSRGPH